jgi:hypothetical protein
MKPPRIMPPVYLLLAIVAMVALDYLLPLRQPRYRARVRRWI